MEMVVSAVIYSFLSAVELYVNLHTHRSTVQR